MTSAAVRARLEAALNQDEPRRLALVEALMGNVELSLSGRTPQERREASSGLPRGSIRDVGETASRKPRQAREALAEQMPDVAAMMQYAVGRQRAESQPAPGLEFLNTSCGTPQKNGELRRLLPKLKARSQGGQVRYAEHTLAILKVMCQEAVGDGYV